MEFLCVQKRSAQNRKYGEFNALAPDRKLATAKHLKVMVERQDIDNAAFKRDLTPLSGTSPLEGKVGKEKV